MYKQFICIIIATFFIGIVFFLYQQSWIIISIPQYTQESDTNSKKMSKQMPVQLWAYKNDRWITESTQIIAHSDNVSIIEQLLNAWFGFVEEENIINKQVTVQSVALSASESEVFISLNQNPFDSQASTFNKLMFIQGLLKTIQAHTTNIQSIRFLIHHHTLIDDHLNFAISWPIDGYIN